MVRAREHDAIRIAPARLIGDGVLYGLAVGRVVRALEDQQGRARPHLQQLGDLPRRQDRIGHLLERLDSQI